MRKSVAPSKLFRSTAYCLLCLYISALLGFIAMGLIHKLQHLIAESRPSHVDSASHVSHAREAGCKPAVDITANSGVGCPGCNQQKKRCAATLKYNHVFNFHGHPAVAVLHLKPSDRHFLPRTERNDQIALQPLTPPPKHLSA